MDALKSPSLAECPFLSKVLSSMDRTAWEKEDSGLHYCSYHAVLVELGGFNLKL